MAKGLQDIVNGIMSKATRRQEMGFGPETYYHGTRADFDEFNDDIWPHVGTQEQATRRLKQTRGMYGREHGMDAPQPEQIMPVNIRAKNPLTVDDVGNWEDPWLIADELKRLNFRDGKYTQSLIEIMNPDDDMVEHFGREGMNQKNMNRLRIILENEGYDSIKYVNTGESSIEDAVDTSMILLRNNQLRDTRAKFDPAFAHSGNLMKGITGLGTLGVAGSSIRSNLSYASENDSPELKQRLEDIKLMRIGGRPKPVERHPMAQNIGDAVSKIKLPIVGEMFPSTSRYFKEFGDSKTKRDKLLNAASAAWEFNPLGIASGIFGDIALESQRDDRGEQ